MCAQERCRISPPRFLAECRKRRLNQASFVLLFFCVVSYFWVVFSLCNVCIFNLFSVLYFLAWTKVNGTVWPYCADMQLRIYSLTHSLTDWLIHWLTGWLTTFATNINVITPAARLIVHHFILRQKNQSYYLASTLWNRLHQCPLINVVLMVVIMILIITIKVLLSWHTCCESVLGSSDECRLSIKQPPTLRPCQPTWAVSSPVGCCRLYSLSYSIQKLITHFTIPRRVEGWVDLAAT